VELLVVIAILAILASLLLPGLNRAKQSARTAKCISNVRQLSLALQMYVGDCAAYPHGDLMDGNRSRLWTAFLAPYLLDGSFLPRNGQADSVTRPAASTVFRCPSAPPPPANTLFDIISYGYNSMGHARQGLGLRVEATTHGVRFAPIKESEVAAPGDMIALGDGMSRIQRFLSTGTLLERNVGMYSSDLLAEIAASDAIARRRHRERIQLGFADGHVESPSLWRTFYDESETALRRWNRDNLPHPEALAQFR